MVTLNSIDIIEIKWAGPFNEEEIFNLKANTDYGLYQIYGTHQIFGTDSLLYIGKSADQLIGDRFSQHKSWLTLEQSKVSVYIGRFGGLNPLISDTSWSKEIDIAERLLIYQCSPPYNSQFINSPAFTDTKQTVVLNFGVRHKLPFQVSTLANETYFAQGKWNPYEYKKE